jgi:hypothetical protein
MGERFTKQKPGEQLPEYMQTDHSMLISIEDENPATGQLTPDVTIHQGSSTKLEDSSNQKTPIKPKQQQRDHQEEERITNSLKYQQELSRFRADFDYLTSMHSGQDQTLTRERFNQIKQDLINSFISNLTTRINELELQKAKYQKSLIMRFFTSGTTAKIAGLTELKATIELQAKSQTIKVSEIYISIEAARKKHPALTKSTFGDRTVTLLNYYHESCKHLCAYGYTRSMIKSRRDELKAKAKLKSASSQPSINQEIQALDELYHQIQPAMDKSQISNQVKSACVQKPILNKGFFSHKTKDLLTNIMNVEQDYQEAAQKYQSHAVTRKFNKT